MLDGYKIPLILFILSVVLFSTTAHAFTISDGLKQATGLISDGGSNLTDNPSGDAIKYKAYVTVGQPIINPETTIINPLFSDPYIIGGNLTDDTDLSDGDTGKYNLCLGAFCTEAFSSPHKIKITGKISYDLGEELANSEVRLKVKYGLFSVFEGESVKTDENGVFNASISIPERIATQPFIISVYANGRVEAEYNCKYNSVTKHCDKI